jgi:hypothetical protein
MRAQNTTILPPELARKVSPLLVNSAEVAGAVGKSALTGVAAVSLYGPVGIGFSDHNGFFYLLGPWVCPILSALFWSAVLARVRMRVYRGTPFSEPTYVDTGDDPIVMRLAELLNSNEARRHLWHETLKESSILFAILGTAAFLLRDSLSWVYPSPGNHFLWTARRGELGSWFWFGLPICLFSTFVILVSDYHRWCLMTWAKRELAHQAGTGGGSHRLTDRTR